jgi:predicted nucleic acid-binding protein
VPDASNVLVLDASVVINLLGCGMGAEILAALPGRAVIADRVERELLHHPIKGLAIDAWIDHWKSQGFLQVIALTEPMLLRYLDLVSQSSPDHLDDGESASIAIAEDWNATAVLDERRARRIVTERFTALRLQSTAGLFQLAANTSTFDQEKLATALYQALTKARMRVVPDDLLDWVVATIGHERALHCRSLPKRFRL